MGIQNDLLKEISKIRTEFSSVVGELKKESNEGSQIQNQVKYRIV